MNISRSELRVLHVLVQGGFIRHRHDDRGRIGHVLSDGTLAAFLPSYGEAVDRVLSIPTVPIPCVGRRAVRAQPDNR